MIEKIYEWVYAKYGYTPSEFRQACCEGRLSAHEYYIEAGFFDDDELREMGVTPKAS